MQANLTKKTKPGKLDPWGILSAVLFIVGVLTVVCLFSKMWWPLDIASNLRLLYLEASLISAVIFALGKRRRQMGAALAIAGINFLLVVPMYIGGGGRSDASECRMLLANVFTVNTEYDRLLKFIRKENPDIIVLEEINAKWVAALAELRSAYPHHIEYPEEDNFGIAFYSRLPVRSLEVKMIGKIKVASIHAVIVNDNQLWNIIGTHPLPPVGKDYWGWRNEQLDKLAFYVAGLDGETVLLGDLNMTPWSYYFRKFMADSGLRDGGKGFGLNISWPAFFPLLGIPIDHCMVSSQIAVNNLRTGENIGSDHYPLVVDVAGR